jgi:hypothetical protein
VCFARFGRSLRRAGREKAKEGREMNKTLILRLVLVLALAMGVAACGGEKATGATSSSESTTATTAATDAEPPTADIRASGSKLYVVISLPEEGTDYKSTHDLTAPGISGTPAKVTIDSPASDVTYPQTGNTYQIGYNIVYENGGVASYKVTVAGNVYGDVIHTLTK